MIANIAVVLSTLAIFATAAPGGPSVSQCNTGKAQCCNQVLDNKNDAVLKQAALVGVAVSDLTGQIGLSCKAIEVVGVLSGTNCAQTPVCCQNNNFNGLINIGCTAVSA